jgi:FPC/CPF motif-containing protein YcgG
MSEYRRLEDERMAKVSEINAEYRQRIKELQESCQHPNLTGWLQGDGQKVRMCKECGKDVKVEPNRPYYL